MRQEALSPRKDDSKDFISNETTTPQDTHHSTKVSTFIDKAFTILKEPAYTDYVGWKDEGNEFVIKQINLFAEEVLWKYFGHRNLSSFTRQLYLYGFVRCASEVNQCAFMHPCFKITSSRKQLAMIKRRKRVSGDKLPKGRKRGASLKKSTNNEMAPADGIQADPSQFVAFHHESITYTEEDAMSPCSWTDRWFPSQLDEFQKNITTSLPITNSHNILQNAPTFPIIHSMSQPYIENFAQVVSDAVLEVRAMRLQLQRQNDTEEDMEPAVFIQTLLERNGIRL